MIGANDICVNPGIRYFWEEAVRYQPVVDTPPCVLGSCLEAVTPPRINILHIWIHCAPRVCEACGQKLCELLALLVRKASIHVIGLGVLQVNFLMSHIHIAANNDGLFSI